MSRYDEFEELDEALRALGRAIISEAPFSWVVRFTEYLARLLNEFTAGN